MEELTMIIVLKPRAKQEDIARVEAMVKRKGLDSHIVVGAEMTIIGCIGDTTQVDPKLFEVDSAVDKVMHVQEPYKLANRAFHPEDSVIDVSGVKVGGGRSTWPSCFRRSKFCIFLAPIWIRSTFSLKISR